MLCCVGKGTARRCEAEAPSRVVFSNAAVRAAGQCPSCSAVLQQAAKVPALCTTASCRMFCWLWRQQGAASGAAHVHSAAVLAAAAAHCLLVTASALYVHPTWLCNILRVLAPRAAEDHGSCEVLHVAFLMTFLLWSLLRQLAPGCIQLRGMHQDWATHAACTPPRGSLFRHTDLALSDQHVEEVTAATRQYAWVISMHAYCDNVYTAML